MGASTTGGDLGKVTLGALAPELEDPQAGGVNGSAAPGRSVGVVFGDEMRTKEGEGVGRSEGGS